MNRLKLWRIQNRYTQQEAANILGFGISAYCLLESGRLLPSDKQKTQLVSYFGDAQSESLFSEVSERVESQ